jgi:hypothetical protein
MPLLWHDICSSTEEHAQEPKKQDAFLQSQLLWPVQKGNKHGKSCLCTVWATGVTKADTTQSLEVKTYVLQ